MQIFLIVFAVITRLVPHAWNFTAVGSVGLFAGANLSLRKALIVPLVPLLISDMMIGFYSWQSMLGVYLGFLMAPVIGHYLIKGREKVITVAGGVGLNTLAFFILSNLGVFATGSYGFTLEGFVSCYVMALPFVSAAFVGDVVFATALFGGKALFLHMQKRQAENAQAA
ncbi:hypothetical protein GCM10017044_12570 [Kordiimonas sediminis]|uniref:Uncharacterized protein n=1 Tax=Kordiimonas sediminis TaxID=1735581 RepID=A0A919APU5_9PROT|nr:DUF6580 family putative transport protein [Kordiimonas sediminis]GHF19420.1 hypothetical protein GCM10017044_12570 [Kordiimonas sediminis]